jgi:adenine-specific DNA-methyltransferase
MSRERTVKSPQIETTIHKKDKRTNIPTKELSGFVKEDEDKPQIIRYPRDTSLDPQLVWKGKDEQDSEDLEVPAVPVYIQEKIHPKYIIEDLRAQAKKEKPQEQLQLFADFNGLKFEDLIEFYQHEQSWANRMILGDSLLVMNSLAEKEGLKGKVQMIYIDPPYGISFASNWQVSTRKRDVKDGKAEDATRQPEQIKAFRDTWKLGIHSYLAYLRDRLVIARELLSEIGSIFVQIGDENVHLVRCLMDEVFGSENFCGLITFVTTGGIRQNLLANRCDFLLWYSRQIELVKYRQLYLSKSVEEGTAVTFTWLELPNGERRGMTAEEKENPSLIPQGAKIYRPSNITTQGNPVFAFEYKGKIYERPWKTTPTGMQRMGFANRLHVASNSLSSVNYLDDFPVSEVTKLWTDTFLGSFAEDKIYAVQTSRKTIERCLLMTTDPGDLVLDPTCGSGTTPYVAEQ